MTKIYHKIEDTFPGLKKTLIVAKKEITPVITEEFLKDSNKRGVAPKQDGFLIDSSIISSLFKEGKIIYNTPYARRLFYEGSISGKVRWLDYNKRKNGKKYRKICEKMFDDIKEKEL